MRYLFFLLWILLGIVYWYVAGNYCCEASTGAATTSGISAVENNSGNGSAVRTAPKSSSGANDRVVTGMKALPVKKLTPIGFECSDDKPNLAAEWESFRDSIIAGLGNNKLQVKAYEYSEESDEEGALALARATNVRKLFALPENKIKLASSSKGDSCLKAEMNNLVEFRFLKSSAKIKEIDDKTLIYFQANSVHKLEDPEIEMYLDNVVNRVKASGEKIRLTGHTDRLGEPADNLRLGQARANTIKDYLVSKGLRPSQIISTSKGELDPIADNETADGRQKNRRTELQIIK